MSAAGGFVDLDSRSLHSARSWCRYPGPWDPCYSRAIPPGSRPSGEEESACLMVLGFVQPPLWERSQPGLWGVWAARGVRRPRAGGRRGLGVVYGPGTIHRPGERVGVRRNPRARSGGGPAIGVNGGGVEVMGAGDRRSWAILRGGLAGAQGRGPGGVHDWAASGRWRVGLRRLR